MAEFIAYLIAGVATGAIYALAAIGFTLVWQTSAARRSAAIDRSVAWA